MTEGSYPRLVIDLGKIGHNAVETRRFCREHGISVTYVVKGMHAELPLMRYLADLGIRDFATSRLGQVRKCHDAGIRADWMLLRPPQRAECLDTVRLCRVSLQSDPGRIRDTEAACEALDMTHGVLLMADMGDLREGFWDRSELFDTLAMIRDSCPRLTVRGLGTVFADLSGVLPTEDKLEAFVSLAEKASEIMGYPMELLSAGSSPIVPDVAEGRMPAAVNHLRLGETVLLAHDLLKETSCGRLDFLSYPTMKLQAEIVELRRKPSVPQGKLWIDAFGNRPVFEDRGMILRAVLAVGRYDVGDPAKLIPLDEGVEIIGATSDHMVVDVEKCPRALKVGDILEFEPRYSAMLYAAASPDVRKVYI